MHKGKRKWFTGKGPFSEINTFSTTVRMMAHAGRSDKEIGQAVKDMMDGQPQNDQNDDQSE